VVRPAEQVSCIFTAFSDNVNELTSVSNEACMNG